MNEELRTRALASMRLIREDIEKDMIALEGLPFEPRAVGIAFGRLAAQVDAVAHAAQILLEDGNGHDANHS